MMTIPACTRWRPQMVAGLRLASSCRVSSRRHGSPHVIGRLQPLMGQTGGQRQFRARARPRSAEDGKGDREGWEPGGRTWFTEEDAREQKLLVTYLFLSGATQEPVLLVIPAALYIFPPTRGLLAPVLSKAATIVRKKFGGEAAQRRTTRPRPPRTAARSWWDPRPPAPGPRAPPGTGEPRSDFRRAGADFTAESAAGTGFASMSAQQAAAETFRDDRAAWPAQRAPEGGGATPRPRSAPWGSRSRDGDWSGGDGGSRSQRPEAGSTAGADEARGVSAARPGGPAPAGSSDVASVWGRVIDIPGGAAPSQQPASLQLFSRSQATPGSPADSRSPPPGLHRPQQPAPNTWVDPIGPATESRRRPAPSAWDSRRFGEEMSSTIDADERRFSGARASSGRAQQRGSGENVRRAAARLRTRRADSPPPRRQRPAGEAGGQGAGGHDSLAMDTTGPQEYIDAAARLWANVWPALDGEQGPPSTWDWDLGRPDGPTRPEASQQAQASAGGDTRSRQPEGVGGGSQAGTPARSTWAMPARDLLRRRGASGADTEADFEALTQWDQGTVMRSGGDVVSSAAQKYWEALFGTTGLGGRQDREPGERADDPLWLKTLLRTFPFLKAWGGFA